MNTKYLFTSLFFGLFGFLSLTSFSQGQQELFKSSESIILGYENDSLFEAKFDRTLITLKRGTNELVITIFLEHVQAGNPAIDSLFRGLKGDIQLETIMDPESFENKENVGENDIYSSSVLVTLNGVQQELGCTYTVHQVKTNNPIYQEKKLTFNVMINWAEFNIESDLPLSNEFEIEITEGLINEK